MEAIPLQAHSHYSLGFGVASVEELARWAAAEGLPCLALTDVESLAGQIRFHDACAAVGIKPVTGVELRARFSRRSVGDPLGRLVLLARDRVGYASLCRIVSRRRQTAETRDPVEALAEGSDGLFVLADDVRTLARLQRAGIDNGDLRFLVSPEVARAGEAVTGSGVPLAASLDLVTLDESDEALHTLLVAIRQGATVDEVRQAGQVHRHHSLESEAEELSRGHPEAILETARIAEACSLDLTTPGIIPPRLPELDPGAGGGELRARCQEGLARLGFAGVSEYEARLELELRTIEHMRFSDYFLAVAEIVRGARELGVPTAGRGSAAGSLVAFVLGMSELDPVAADLLFERFLHEQRDAPPDIDLDVASTGRDELNSWVVRRFGRERVAGIASYATFRVRSAVRSALSAFGVDRSKVDSVIRRLDRLADGEGRAEPVELALRESLIPAARQAAPLIRRLLGMPSHLSAHPGGIVIGNRPLAELVPLERAPGGTIVTQYDYRAVERAGFLKIDLLGNHFLSEMQETLAALPARTSIPPDDRHTWQMLDRADTIGCFQVESPAVRSVLRRLPMKRFADLVAALAVVRPGAAAGAAKERFIRRARGEEEYRPLEILGRDSADERYVPLRERLARTHGVLLYDEDIIRLLAAVGSISFASADALRTSMIVAGESPQALLRLGNEFVARAVSSGAPEGVARRSWQAAARFASYSFAEAHAASYAALAWKAAWLRTHAPVEFGCALINHHRGLYPLRTTAAAVQRWGVQLLLPSVNSSDLASKVVHDPSLAVRTGLAAIKGLSRRTSADIIEGRPFEELGELIERARPAKRELRALLLSGACDELPPLSPAGYPLVHQVILEGLAGEASPGALADVLRSAEARTNGGKQAAEYRDYQQLVRVRNELESLGMHLTEHPMRLLRSEAQRLGCLPANQLDSKVGSTVRFAGILAAFRRVPTGEDELRFLTWEDETGLVEGVLFPRENARLGERLTTPGPYLVEGVMRETDGDLHLEVAELKPFHER